jgi:hypothetical protein
LPSEENRVARPTIPIEGVERDGKARANGIEVNVGHKLEQVWLLLDKRGLEPVLEEMATATVTPIENGAVGTQPRLD